MTSNRAAWLMAAKTRPFVVDKAPTYKPGRGEVLIRNHAVAVNPVDWKIQDSGSYLNTYPFILGRDTAGTIEEVGEGVTNFHRGQRVIAHLHSPKTGNYAHAAYQMFSLATERLTSALPTHISFEQGCVLPLSISTAAAGLYLPQYLGLSMPSSKEQAKGHTILIWGGASSVGLTAIQLATASGYNVITTASSHNHKLVRSLGAKEVLDYHSPQLVDDLVTKLQDTGITAIYDATGSESSFKPLRELLRRLGRFVPTTSVHPAEHTTELFRPTSISSYGIAFPPNEAIGEEIWGSYLPKALEKGSFRAKPDAYIIGNGLESVQLGLDIQKNGVSAKKMVITLR